MSTDMPYTWLNIVLNSLGAGAFVGALVCVVMAIFRGQGKRKRPWLGAGYCLAGFVVLGAANYALIVLVQLPAVAQQKQLEAQRARQERHEATSLVKLGDRARAPSFRIHRIDGSEFALDQQRGKVVLLNFFATWCGPCIKELPHIQEIWKAHKARNDFALLVVGREESDETVHAFLEKHGYSFPAAADPERSVYSQFAKELIPRTYLIARDGTICYATTGFREEDVDILKDELARQLRATE